MWEWLSSLFATEGFRPRWQDGDWPAWLAWLHVSADVVTFCAYVAIPIVMASFILRRRDMPYPGMFALFAAFIFVCGAVHAVEAMTFWRPMYYLEGWLKAATALLSVAAVVLLVPTLRAALRMPGFQRVTARLASIVAASNDAVISKSLDGIVESWNGAAERMYGYRADEMVGRSIETIVPRERREELRELTERVRNGEVVSAFETVRITKSGDRIPVSLTISPLLGLRGETVALSAIARDVSDRKQAEEQLRATAARLARANARLRELADRDPLTGLLNRRGLEAALAVEVERFRRHGTEVTVVLIDCDDFKSINERHGHDGGDEVLREVASRVEDTARQVDTVARIGGDEFLVLVAGARTAEAARFADRVREAVASAPVRLPDGQCEVRVSCGVESVDGGRQSLETLVGETSAALRAAKSAGKDATFVAGEEEHNGAPQPAHVEAADLRAVAQPIVELQTRNVVAHEFLVRGPAGPLHSPDELFRAYRMRRQLTRLDLDCLDCCLRASRALPPDQRVHVNVLPSTLLELEDGEIAARLAPFAVRDRLCLELNEAMLIGDPSALVPKVAALRDATGCKLALDDVGFGRSSLEALVRLEPDVIKIDRRYIHGVAGDVVQRRGLERLVGIGLSLGAEVIAEGVETEADRAVLLGLGVTLAQGFYFGRPASLN